jgi:hypothetical protein
MECGQEEVGIRLERVRDSVTALRAKAFVFYVRVTVAALDVLSVCVFATGIFHWHLVPKNRC